MDTALVLAFGTVLILGFIAVFFIFCALLGLWLLNI